MWGVSSRQCVVAVLWLNLPLQKICRDLEHWFPTILASSPSSFLCVIHHAVALLSPYLLGLRCVSAMASITFSSIPTGFGITSTEVTVLCSKMLSSWGGTFTGVKNTGFFTSGEPEILTTAPDWIHVGHISDGGTCPNEELQALRVHCRFPSEFKLQLGAIHFQPGCFYFT